MSGAGAVVAFVMLEWATGTVVVAAWAQSWTVVRRGHFRIAAWVGAGLAAFAVIANSSATETIDAGLQPAFVMAAAVACVIYLSVQYVRSDIPGVVVGAITAVIGGAALVRSGTLVEGWVDGVAAAGLLAGALLIGGVTNGMLLGHWYLNQPGLKPWALARLTSLALVATVLSLTTGLAGADALAGAETEGADLGLIGTDDSLGGAFFLIWLGVLGFTGVVVWMARRCIAIRSIQSATGLYYVGLLTAGVSEFLVRYLMVNAT